eukprot:tig00000949_g5728.t1
MDPELQAARELRELRGKQSKVSKLGRMIEDHLEITRRRMEIRALHAHAEDDVDRKLRATHQQLVSFQNRLGQNDRLLGESVGDVHRVLSARAHPPAPVPIWEAADARVSGASAHYPASTRGPLSSHLPAAPSAPTSRSGGVPALPPRRPAPQPARHWNHPVYRAGPGAAALGRTAALGYSDIRGAPGGPASNLPAAASHRSSTASSQAPRAASNRTGGSAGAPRYPSSTDAPRDRS